MEFFTESTADIPQTVIFGSCNMIRQQMEAHPQTEPEILKLFPKFISHLSNNNKFAVTNKEGKKSTVTGFEARKMIFTDICSIEWMHLDKIIPIFKEMMLQEDEIFLIFKNALKKITTLSIKDVASSINQVLNLSTKGGRRLIIQWIIDYFDHLEKEIEVSSEILACQQAILLHLNYIVTQDIIGKEIIKICKLIVPTSFSVSMLLSIMSCPNYKDTVLKNIKSLILNEFSESNLEPFLPQKGFKSLITYRSIFADVVARSANGLDGLVVNLVSIGFFLMEQKEPILNMIGSEMICSTFKLHSSVRKEVFVNITTRFMIKHEKLEIFIDLLQQLIAMNLMDIEKSKIKELIDFVMMLTPEQASKSFEALEPLYCTNSDILDYLILVTRKCFSLRENSLRQIGILGFVHLIKSKKSIRSNSREIDQELLAYLQRGFSHSELIKRTLYHSFYEIAKAKPELTETILNYMHFQLEKYYNEKVTSGRITFEKCIFTEKTQDVCTVSEPLAFLFFSISKMLSLNPSNSDHKIKEWMDEICHVLIKASLEDFDLDGQTDFSFNTSEGKQHQLIAGTILGCIQVFMEYIGNDAEAVDQLYSLHNRLFDLVKSKTKVKKGEKKGKFVLDSFVPVLSTAWSCEMLKIVATERNSPLSSDKRFKEFLIQLIITQLEGITDIKSKIPLLCDLSTSLHLCILDLDDESSDKKKKIKSFSNNVVECFYTCFEKIRSLNSADAMRKWFDAIHPNVQHTDIKELIRENLFWLETEVETCLEKERFLECKYFLDIIFSLLRWTNGLSSHLIWITRVVTNTSLDSVPVVKSLVRVFCRLAFMNDSIDKVLPLVKDIRNINGERNDVTGTSQTGQVSHAIIDQQTSEQVCVFVLGHMNEMVDFLSHSYKKTILEYSRQVEYANLKMIKNVTSVPSNKTLDQDKIYDHLMQVIEVIHPLLQSTLESSSISLYETCQKVYQLACVMAKFVNTEYKESKKTLQISVRFEDLIASIRTHIHQYIYHSIAFYNDQSSKQETKLSKLQKESRVIPDLIFSIEEIEKELIKLSEATEKNFMKDFKRAKARGFQINIKEIKKSKKKQGSHSTQSSIDELDDESSRDFEMLPGERREEEDNKSKKKKSDKEKVVKKEKKSVLGKKKKLDDDEDDEEENKKKKKKKTTEKTSGEDKKKKSTTTSKKKKLVSGSEEEEEEEKKKKKPATTSKKKEKKMVTESEEEEEDPKKKTKKSTTEKKHDRKEDDDDKQKKKPKGYSSTSSESEIEKKKKNSVLGKKKLFEVIDEQDDPIEVSSDDIKNKKTSDKKKVNIKKTKTIRFDSEDDIEDIESESDYPRPLKLILGSSYRNAFLDDEAYEDEGVDLADFDDESLSQRRKEKVWDSSDPE